MGFDYHPNFVILFYFSLFDNFPQRESVSLILKVCSKNVVIEVCVYVCCPSTKSASFLLSHDK